jgi:hypothetical protein
VRLEGSLPALLAIGRASVDSSFYGRGLRLGVSGVYSGAIRCPLVGGARSERPSTFLWATCRAQFHRWAGPPPFPAFPLLSLGRPSALARSNPYGPRWRYLRLCIHKYTPNRHSSNQGYAKFIRLWVGLVPDRFRYSSEVVPRTKKGAVRSGRGPAIVGKGDARIAGYYGAIFRCSMGLFSGNRLRPGPNAIRRWRSARLSTA